MESDHEETQDVADTINVIHVYDDHYSNVNSPQVNTAGGRAIKGKYYKQTYRTAWESTPDFEGWLRGVQGQPTRAYCLYCQKTLHAHRLSLLKHMCTIRHQKAAQVHKIRKAKIKMESQNNQVIEVSTTDHNEDSNCAEGETVVEYAEMEDYEQGDSPEPDDLDEEEHEGEEYIERAYQPQQAEPTPMATSVKPPISTHVLDSVKGVPAVGVPVTLYRLIDGRWTYMNEGTTSTDGRFSGFFTDRDGFQPGRYKLHYDVDRFFDKKQDSLFPFVEIIIDCKNVFDSYHVPLILAPNSYTTYRGS